MGLHERYYGDSTFEAPAERDERLVREVCALRRRNRHPRASVLLDEKELPYHGE